MFDLGLKESACKLRVVAGDRKIDLKHFLRLPTESEWKDYLKSRGFMGLSKGRETFEFSNVNQEDDSALWSLLVTRVEGYKIDGEDLMKSSDWKERVPIQHKLNAIGGMLSFTREDAVTDDSLIQGEFFDVGASSSLEIKFAAIFNENKEVISFKFRNPDTSDYVKYNRMATKMQMTRTKQKGVSTIKSPVNVSLLVEFFDKLIVSVDGYTFVNKDKWVSEIPVLHKREAVRELFSGSIREDEETGQD